MLCKYWYPVPKLNVCKESILCFILSPFAYAQVPTIFSKFYSQQLEAVAGL